MAEAKKVVRILSVLGTTDYKPVSYIYPKGERRHHHFFQKTLHDHIRETQPHVDKRINVLLTAEARAKNWAQPSQPTEHQSAPYATLWTVTPPKTYLHTELGSGDGMDIDIPKGATEAELWDIFNAVVKVVQLGENVVLDVTHGFRTQPMLLLLAAGYLRTAK